MQSRSLNEEYVHTLHWDFKCPKLSENSDVRSRLIFSFQLLYDESHSILHSKSRDKKITLYSLVSKSIWTRCFFRYNNGVFFYSFVWNTSINKPLALFFFSLFPSVSLQRIEIEKLAIIFFKPFFDVRHLLKSFNCYCSRSAEKLSPQPS